MCSGLDGDATGWDELLKELGDLSVGLVSELTLGLDGVEERLMLGSEVGKVELLELANLVGLDLIEVSLDTGVENADLLLGGHWDVLLLLEELSELLTSVEELLGGSIKIRTELGEGSDLSVLSEIELHGTGDLLHGLDLGSGTDSGYGKTDVNGWSDTLVEELSLQEDLSISDRDNVGWDISRYITSLGLNDWEGGEGTSTVVLVHLSGSLEETRVKIEDISWVGLSTWWSSEEEGHLSVSDGLLGKIVIDDEGVLGVVSEVLTNGASRVWGQELEWSGIGGSGSNDDGVVHGAVILKDLDNVGDGGSLLTNGNVDAVKLLGLIGASVTNLLVKDGINSNSSLTGLSITNDELSLASTDWHKGIDGLESSLHWLVHGLSWDDTWSLELNSLSLVRLDWTKTINWSTEWINDSTEHTVTDWDIDDGTGSLNDISLLDLSIVTQDDDTNIVSLQVKGHTHNSGVELNHLSCLDLHETEDSCNTITDRDNGTEFLKVVLYKISV